MAWYNDLAGTTNNSFLIGAANIFKAITGGFAIRNAADNADAKLQASQFEATGNTGLIINSDSAGSGADYKITINRPSSGMTADYTLTLPIDDGSPAQVLSTDGSGNLSWVSAASTAALITVDTTSLAFGTASPLTLFSTPSGAVIHKVEIIVDTQFNGSPTLTVGVAGTTSKYMGSGQNVLTTAAGNAYEANPKLPASAGEALIATYAAGGASAGAARILVSYSVPS